MPSELLPRLAADLARASLHEVLERYVGPAPAGALDGDRAWIDHCYAADTVEDIVERLLGSGVRAAKEAAATLAAKSPTSLKVTLAALRRVRELGPLERALEQEYRISCAALSSPTWWRGSARR